MSSKKPLRKDMLSSCDEVGPDDGLAPRSFIRDLPRTVPNRKALQLCSQVERTLSGVLLECGDDVLRELMVASVVPAPNSAHLLVTVCPGPGAGGVDLSQVMERLTRVHGRLRMEVAAAINRRKAPELLFQVSGGDEK